MKASEIQSIAKKLSFVDNDVVNIHPDGSMSVSDADMTLVTRTPLFPPNEGVTSAVSNSLLLSIANRLSGEITVANEEHMRGYNFTGVDGDISYIDLISPKADRRKPPEVREYINVSIEDIDRDLDFVLRSADKRERFNYTGFLKWEPNDETSHFVRSTDNFRVCSARRNEGIKNSGFSVPYRAVKILGEGSGARILQFNRGEITSMVQAGDDSIMYRNMVGTFPDIKKLETTEFKFSAKVASDIFKKAIRKVSGAVDREDEARPLTLNFLADGLKISTRCKGATSVEKMEFQPDMLNETPTEQVVVNHKHLTDFLVKSDKKDWVTITIGEPEKPVSFRHHNVELLLVRIHDASAEHKH